MCGRFTQHYTWQQIHEFLGVIGAPQNLQARYNIAPTTLIGIVRYEAKGRRELVRGVRWGLIPGRIGDVSAMRRRALTAGNGIYEMVRTGDFVPPAQP